MNIETVNELIQSLESAGELSIKERKHLDLAKAYADKEAEMVAQALTFQKCRELSGCPAGVDLQDWVKQLAAENAYLIPKAASELSNAWVLHKYLIGIQAAIMYLDNGNKKAAQEWLYGTIAGPGFEFPDEVDDIDAWATHQMRGSISHPRALEIIKEETPATDRIVAGIKADGAAEREKTITFTAAKKRTQDSVALIAIGKHYKIHNDDVIGEFFIGERGRYGVITMDCLDYFTTSEEYAWEFSLREGADK